MLTDALETFIFLLPPPSCFAIVFVLRSKYVVAVACLLEIESRAFSSVFLVSVQSLAFLKKFLASNHQSFWHCRCVLLCPCPWDGQSEVCYKPSRHMFRVWGHMKGRTGHRRTDMVAFPLAEVRSRTVRPRDSCGGRTGELLVHS